MTTEDSLMGLNYCPSCGKKMAFTLADDYLWRDSEGHVLVTVENDNRLDVFDMFCSKFFDDEA